MDSDALLNERHYSSRMALQLKRTGFPRPSSRCDAHAIISGSHKLAAQMRAILAWLKMRIDDHHNGCWLPRNITDKVHMTAFLRDARTLSLSLSMLIFLMIVTVWQVQRFLIYRCFTDECF